MGTLSRRGFLSLVGLGAAGYVGRSYFDMGAAWAKHAPPAIATSGWKANAAGVMLRGAMVTIDGVFATHPVTGVALPFLRSFVVTEDVTASEPDVQLVQLSPSYHRSRSAKSRVRHLSLDL